MVEEEPLNEKEQRLWEYIKSYDFVGHTWSTPNAAAKLGWAEDDVYQVLSDLIKKMKGKLYIYYKGGGLRIATE
jgi:hypothetical protein